MKVEGEKDEDKYGRRTVNQMGGRGRWGKNASEKQAVGIEWGLEEEKEEI